MLPLEIKLNLIHIFVKGLAMRIMNKATGLFCGLRYWRPLLCVQVIF